MIAADLVSKSIDRVGIDPVPVSGIPAQAAPVTLKRRYSFSPILPLVIAGLMAAWCPATGGGNPAVPGLAACTVTVVAPPSASAGTTLVFDVVTTETGTLNVLVEINGVDLAVTTRPGDKPGTTVCCVTIPGGTSGSKVTISASCGGSGSTPSGTLVAPAHARPPAAGRGDRDL